MTSEQRAPGDAAESAPTETALATHAPPLPTILHYRVLEKLGEGGMGAVFKAHDQRLGRVVAIKRVALGAGREADARLRLVREARAAAALSHPNIVTIFAIEEDDAGAFIVMEYLEGETLAARISRGPLDTSTVCRLGAEIADALACAHAAGLVHRDIKPANVILTPRGSAKVLDFGVAKSSVGDALAGAALTAPGALVGTGPYMSPEQLRSHPIDGRSDVFALGCVLYEAATARRAFPGADLATLVTQITTLDPVPPRTLVPALPPSLEATVLRALAKEPARRFSSASDMAAALRVVESPRAKTTTTATPSSVAVLSFRDLSAAHDQGYLCEGIAEEILTALTHVDGLRVAARSSSFQVAASGSDARTAGARLGVDAVLEGAVRKAGERLRVTVQLVDVVDGYQRWSHRFDGAAADVFAIQDEIASTVATVLRGAARSTDREALRRPGTTPEAYEHFLRGRQLFHVNSEASLLEAELELRRSIDLDATYAPAHAMLAQLHAWKVEWFGAGDRGAAAGDAASARAVELGPQLAEAHVARAVVLGMRRGYVAAEREFEEAIRLNPQSFEAHYSYARMCFQTGNDERAAELFRRASEVQVEDFQSPILAWMPLARLGRVDDAEASLREGIRRAERLLSLDPANVRALSLGATALVQAGDHERARAWSGRALEVAPEDPGANTNVACVYLRLGDKDAALRCLEKTFGRGIGKRDWVEHDPDYDSVRNDPRFQAMIAKLK